MSIPASLDPDLLRSFVFIAEDGSFTRAALRVGRTQSAVSMQMQRLEALLGRPILARGKGGIVSLTTHGEFLLSRAREMLAMNDAIWTSFHEPPVHGTVRLGAPDDYALRYLPQILKRFAESHPAVEVEVLCLPSSELVARLRDGLLDLTLLSDGHELPHWPTVPLWRGPLSWITSDRHSAHRKDPLPVALAREGCAWRIAATTALEAAGRRYRIAYSSATQIGTHAPVMAGLAVTISTISWLPDGLRRVRPEEGLPPLPDYAILLMQAREPRQPVTSVLARYITDTFNAEATRVETGQRSAA